MIFRNKFLTETDITDGRTFALQFLRDAIERRDRINVEWGLALAFEFGFSPEHLSLLIGLIDEDWHVSHAGYGCGR